MVSVKEVYKKERITAEEVFNIKDTEQRKAIILSVEEGTRTYKEQDYGFLLLTVEFNKDRRKLQLSYNNAQEIAKSLGDNTDNWLNAILLLNATPDEKGYNRMNLFVWGRA